MRLTNTQKAGLVALLASIAVLAFAWIQATQKDFEKELKRAASSDLDYLTLCSVHGNPKPQPCQTIHRAGNQQQFATAIGYLSQATSASRPNKISATNDMILKLGRGSPESRDYLACYRATKYPGVDQIFISPIGTDRECTWPDQYHAGSVAIPANAFGRGAI